MTIYDFELDDINKQKVKLSKYKGKVVLIVNVASKCGFTNQYKELEALYRKYQEQGFEILGFPCGQFKFQEFNDNEEIKQFCKMNYDVTFQLFDKIKVKGSNKHPLYEYLINTIPVNEYKNSIRWNFEKFLIDREGNVINRFAPDCTPTSFESEIQNVLNK